MAGLTEKEIKIINGLLYDQKKEIMKEVSEKIEDIRDNYKSLSGNIETLVNLASSAKSTAEKTYSAIEGNGAIGIKTQVRQNNEEIKKLSDKFDKKEKEYLQEKIKEAECSEELKEKKYNRRAEDKRSKRKDAIALATVLLTVLSGILIQFIIASGGKTP